MINSKLIFILISSLISASLLAVIANAETYKIPISKYVVLNEYNPEEVYSPLDMYVGRFNSDKGEKMARTLVFFDTSRLENKHILNAYLEMDIALISESTTEKPYQIAIYRALEQWDKATWYNSPNIGNNIIASPTISGDGTYTISNLRDAVRSWVVIPSYNFGLIIKGMDEKTLDFKQIKDIRLVVEYTEANECNQNGGMCRSECGSGEEEIDYSCAAFGKNCCVKEIRAAKTATEQQQGQPQEKAYFKFTFQNWADSEVIELINHLCGKGDWKETNKIYECNFENGNELDGAYELALDIFGEPFENIPRIAIIKDNKIEFEGLNQRDKIYLRTTYVVGASTPSIELPKETLSHELIHSMIPHLLPDSYGEGITEAITIIIKQKLGYAMKGNVFDSYDNYNKQPISTKGREFFYDFRFIGRVQYEMAALAWLELYSSNKEFFRLFNSELRAQLQQDSQVINKAEKLSRIVKNIIPAVGDTPIDEWFDRNHVLSINPDESVVPYLYLAGGEFPTFTILDRKGNGGQPNTDGFDVKFQYYDFNGRLIREDNTFKTNIEFGFGSQAKYYEWGASYVPSWDTNMIWGRYSIIAIAKKDGRVYKDSLWMPLPYIKNIHGVVTTHQKGAVKITIENGEVFELNVTNGAFSAQKLAYKDSEKLRVYRGRTKVRFESLEGEGITRHLYKLTDDLLIILDDNPFISHSPIIRSKRKPLEIKARVYGADNVYLYFKHSAQKGFSQAEMQKTGGNDFSATVPKDEGSDYLEYYILAENGQLKTIYPQFGEENPVRTEFYGISKYPWEPEKITAYDNTGSPRYLSIANYFQNTGGASNSAYIGGGKKSALDTPLLMDPRAIPIIKSTSNKREPSILKIDYEKNGESKTINIFLPIIESMFGFVDLFVADDGATYWKYHKEMGIDHKSFDEAVEAGHLARAAEEIVPEAPNMDFDSDGGIDFGDFLLFAKNYGKQEGDEGFDAKFDLNGNGKVDFADFLIFAKNYGGKEGDAKPLPLAKPAALIGDFNGDGCMKFDDFLLLAKYYNKNVDDSNKEFDLDKDGVRIGFGDFLIFAQNYGKCRYLCSICPDLNGDGMVSKYDVNHWQDRKIDMDITGIVDETMDMNKDGRVDGGDEECILANFRGMIRTIECGSAPSCFDGMQNQDELMIDYGGVCFNYDKDPPFIVDFQFPDTFIRGKKFSLIITVGDKEFYPTVSAPNHYPVTIHGSGIDISSSYIGIFDSSNQILNRYNLNKLIQGKSKDNSRIYWLRGSLIYDTSSLPAGVYTISFYLRDMSGNDKATNYTFEIKEKVEECVLLQGNGDNKNLDIVFVADGFKSRLEFLDIVNRHIQTLMSVEPFKSNANLINIKIIDTLKNFGCEGDPLNTDTTALKRINMGGTGGASSSGCLPEDIIEFVRDKCFVDEIVLLSREDFRSFTFGFFDQSIFLDQSSDVSSFPVIFVGKDRESSIIKKTFSYDILQGSGPEDKAYIAAPLDCVKFSLNENPKVLELEVFFEGKKLLFLNNLIVPTPSPKEVVEGGYAGTFIPPVCGHSDDVYLDFIERVNLEDHSPRVFIHEFGHSFGHLSDEYLVYLEKANLYFQSVNCIDPKENSITCYPSENSKAIPVAGCTYANLCRGDYRTIMSGSSGRLDYGKKSEEHMLNRLLEITKNSSGKGVDAKPLPLSKPAALVGDFNGDGCVDDTDMVFANNELQSWLEKTDPSKSRLKSDSYGTEFTFESDVESVKNEIAALKLKYDLDNNGFIFSYGLDAKGNRQYNQKGYPLVSIALKDLAFFGKHQGEGL